MRKKLMLLFLELLLIMTFTPPGVKTAPANAPAPASVLTLTNAINTALTNNQAIIQTQFDYHTSYAKLLKAAGILDSSKRMNEYEQ